MYVNILTPTYRLTVPWYNHGSDLVFCACLPLPPYKLSVSSLPFKDRLRRFLKKGGTAGATIEHERSSVCLACVLRVSRLVSRMCHVFLILHVPGWTRTSHSTLRTTESASKAESCMLRLQPCVHQHVLRPVARIVELCASSGVFYIFD